jgi:hypothetical protein
VHGLADYEAACRRDGGRLWGRSLCGPLIVMDPGSHFAIATARPPAGGFARSGALWIGRATDDVPASNTSFDWASERWATARLPLPADRFLRTALLVHESFHRIQPALGLVGPDRPNPHLDERNGRLLLRLELRALGAALRTSGKPAREAAGDALVFAAYRHALYPGSDTLERALELQEGLAEYTGHRLALDYLHEPAARVADALAAFESRPTYVRSLGYAIGPGIGILLDRYATGWRRRVGRVGLERELARALGFVPPKDLASAAAGRGARYGSPELEAAEDVRAREREARLADYTRRLVTGPVLVLSSPNLSRGFDPNALVAFGDRGTVYPTGTFAAEWGTLEVTGGALLAPDNRTVTVPAPAAADTAARPLHGDGWTFALEPGWAIVSGARPGDLTVRKTP